MRRAIGRVLSPGLRGQDSHIGLVKKAGAAARGRGPTIMGLFGEFQVRIDPWQAEYGPELAVDSDSTDARESTLEDVDVPRSLWQPIFPASTAAPPALVFVD